MHKNRLLYTVILYLILLFASIIFFDIFSDNIENFYVTYIKGLNLSHSYLFFILFIIQELLLLIFMIFAFQYYFKDNLVNSIKKIKIYFSDKFGWQGFKKLLKYTFGMFILLYMIQFVILLISILFKIKLPGFFGEQNIATMLGNFQTNGFLDVFLLYLSVAIIGPFVEEIIYRGFITEFLLQKYGKFLGMFYGATIFAIIHMEFEVMGNLFILSMILSYIYMKTGSIKYSFAFHFMINFISLTLTLIFL